METTLHCEICNIDCKTKANYNKHMISNRHIHRKTNAPIIYSCKCGRTYTYHQSLYYHRKTCEIHQNSKVGYPQNEKMNLQVQQLQAEKEEMRQKLMVYENEHKEMKAQIAMLLDKYAGNSNTTNNHGSIDNQTNNNITININAFGNENIEYLDDKTINDCIERVYKSIPTLLEKIHFDPNHPENHNIKITNKKLPYASVMGNNQKWKTVDRKDAIETMVNNGYNLLDVKYVENKDKFPLRKQQNFEGFQTKFENEDKGLMKQLKTDVEMMVLNG